MLGAVGGFSGWLSTEVVTTPAAILLAGAVAVVTAAYVAPVSRYRRHDGCSTATVAAMALPWLFDVFGFDPAFGSGPLATGLQDLLSIWIHLFIATLVIS
jgi:Mg/Co/Ni transporter MgtE